MTRINLFNSYYRKRYGQRVEKIALDLGIPCPNRLYGGCSYCSAKGFTPYYLTQETSTDQQLVKGKAFLAARKARLYFAYFQQETSTACGRDVLGPAVSLPLRDPDCIGIIISTRPDYLPEYLPGLLNECRKAHPEKNFLIELGLQSSNDATLKSINRNHSYSDYLDAVSRLKKHPFLEIGAHLIIGLPGENLCHFRKTLTDAVNSGIDHLKIHHLQVVKGAPLDEVHQTQPIKLLELDEYMEILCQLLPDIPENIVIHRLWSNCSTELLTGPIWNRRSREIYDLLNATLEKRNICQGQNRLISGGNHEHTV